MDVILITGLNNLLRGYKSDDMLGEYDHLVRFVMYQAHRHHHELHNTGTLY